MTEEGKSIFNEYGTVYPCCGNCIFIREVGFWLICRKYLEYRDYDSVKCVDYKHEQHINKLEELELIKN